MLEIYQASLAFAPAAFYGAIGTILFLFRAFTFNRGIALFTVSYLGHAVVTLTYNSWLPLVAQSVIAFVLFILMVMIFSGKISGETILTMTALFALTPIPSGILAIVLTFLLFGIYAAIQLSKTGAFKHAMRDAVASTGMAQTAPSYEHLQDRREVAESEQKVSLLPFMAIVYIGCGLFFLLSTALTVDF